MDLTDGKHVPDDLVLGATSMYTNTAARTNLFADFKDSRGQLRTMLRETVSYL